MCEDKYTMTPQYSCINYNSGRHIIIEELEKIKAELQTPNLPGDKVIIRGDCYISLSYMSYILDHRIKELKGETE
jgi:hypothetical protein